MMKLLYFAHIKELVGKTEEQIELNKKITVLEFKQYLLEKYPEINGEIYQVAVNEEFVQDQYQINENDTVALIPPVSGG